MYIAEATHRLIECWIKASTLENNVTYNTRKIQVTQTAWYSWRQYHVDNPHQPNTYCYDTNSTLQYGM